MIENSLVPSDHDAYATGKKKKLAQLKTGHDLE